MTPTTRTMSRRRYDAFTYQVTFRPGKAFSFHHPMSQEIISGVCSGAFTGCLFLRKRWRHEFGACRAVNSCQLNAYSRQQTAGGGLLGEDNRRQCDTLPASTNRLNRFTNDQTYQFCAHEIRMADAVVEPMVALPPKHPARTDRMQLLWDECESNGDFFFTPFQVHGSPVWPQGVY